MSSSVKQRVTSLLEAVLADWPRRVTELDEIWKESGDGSLRELDPDYSRLEIGPPAFVMTIPTFCFEAQRPPSPMLEARFEHSGCWKCGFDLWLTPADMLRWLADEGVQSTHKALRGYWERSAPMTHPDDALTLFGVTEGVPQNITYLVWIPGEIEPEVWVYQGQSAYDFRNLEEYLTWCLERE